MATVTETLPTRTPPAAPHVGACLSCGAGYGETHKPWCEFKIAPASTEAHR